jgi:hypothetical protein
MIPFVLSKKAVLKDNEKSDESAYKVELLLGKTDMLSTQ